MYARLNHRQIPPGKMDEAVRIYREVTGPDRRAQPGFRQGLVLTNRDTGKLMAIALWESESHMRSAAAPPQYADAVTGSPTAREEYEVAAQDGESAIGRAGFARVNYHQVAANKVDEVAGIYQNSVLPQRRTHQGFLGGLVLANRDRGKLVTISFWDSEGSNQAAGRGGLADPLVGPPGDREGYELSALV